MGESTLKMVLEVGETSSKMVLEPIIESKMVLLIEHIETSSSPKWSC